jgi:hypothetical protein
MIKQTDVGCTGWPSKVSGLQDVFWKKVRPFPARASTSAFSLVHVHFAPSFRLSPEVRLVVFASWRETFDLALTLPEEVISYFTSNRIPLIPNYRNYSFSGLERHPETMRFELILNNFSPRPVIDFVIQSNKR